MSGRVISLCGPIKSEWFHLRMLKVLANIFVTVLRYFLWTCIIVLWFTVDKNHTMPIIADDAIFKVWANIRRNLLYSYYIIPYLQGHGSFKWLAQYPWRLVILSILNNIESHNVINNNLWNRYDVGSAPIMLAQHRTVSRAYLCHA